MNKKLYVTGTEEEKNSLREFIKTSPESKAHHRAQAILWSMEGRSRTDLAALFAVKADTISAWFKRWQTKDFTHLSDEPRSGRPSMLNESEKKTF